MSTITPAAVTPVSNGFNTNPSYSGTFIPTLWSAKLNAKFYAATVFGEIANTNWEGDIKSLGDKVVINNIPTITINDYTVGTNLSYEVPTPNTLTLQIDKGKYFAFQVNDVLSMQAEPKLMDVFSNDASMQMKISIDSTVLGGTFQGGAAANKGATAGNLSGSYNLGTDAAPVDLSGSNILQTITAMAAVLDEQNVPETERYLVIDPATRQTLMSSNLAQAQFMGDGQSIVRNGKIGVIDRFTVYVSNQLPKAAAGKDWAGATSAGTAKRRAILAGHKSAISFASQMTKMETVRNPNDFGDFVRGLNVFGYTVAKPESLVLGVVA